MRIIFMGTPEFAVASLDALIRSGKNIVAVVTAPDKPAGRGRKLQTSAVKDYAAERNIPLLQPPNLKDSVFLSALKEFNADLQVVVAFRMLPEVVWNMPPKGTINLHASLLPQYRGAAPINHAILNGDRLSGVTTFFLQHAIDTGHIIMSRQTEIGPDDTAGELHDKLMHLGAELLVDTVNAIASGNYQQTPQPEDSGTLKPAPKIFKEDCRINWNQSVEQVYNQIRGLSPYPTAYTDLHGSSLKIFRASAEKVQIAETPGTPMLSEKRSGLKFACTDGYLHVLDVQLQGKKRMDVSEFLRGYRFP